MPVQTYYEDLHKIPEISEKEYKTSEYIGKTLQSFGYTPVKTAETGVYTDLVTDENAPWLLLRADIDALPIREETALSYRSTMDGCMHACGHDAHSAMLLEAARILKNEKLPQNIRFLFQPAEETTKGAAKVIRDGAVPTNVCACFAMHLWPGVGMGKVTTSAEVMMASSDVFRIHITGQSVHCAKRESGRDAMHTAVDIASTLYFLSEELQKKDTILFCGSIHSGESHNIVPNHAELYGTIRTFSPDERTKCRQLLEETCITAAAKHGTTASVLWDGGCPPLCSDAGILRKLKNFLPELDTNAPRTYAAEDFAEYRQTIPGAMLWLGIGDTQPLHSKDFIIPCEILPVGVSLWTKIAMQKWWDA